METIRKQLKIKDDNKSKLKLFSVKSGHKSMEQTIMSNLDIVKNVKKAHARLKRERPDIYHQFVSGIFE